MLDKQQISKNFSRSAPDYDRHALLQKEMADGLLDKLRGLNPKAVLDVGCGTGYLTRKLAEMFPRAEALGIDIAPGMIEVANRQKRSNLRFSVGDGEGMKEREKHDLVVSNASLQWMDAEKVFRGVHKILKPGGRFAFTTFGPRTLRELKESGFRVNHFLSAKELKQIIGNKFAAMSVQSAIASQKFKNIKELICHFKEVGAHATDSKNKTDPEAFRKYKEKFGGKGFVWVSYEVIYGMLLR